MEKIVELKKHEETRLKTIQGNETNRDLPVELPQYTALLGVLRTFASDTTAMEAKAKIIQRLVGKVEITPNSYKIHFYVGKDHIGRLTSAHNELKKQKKRGFPEVPGAPEFGNHSYFGSNSFALGWGTRTRT